MVDFSNLSSSEQRKRKHQVQAYTFDKTHISTTDPDASVVRRGHGRPKLQYQNSVTYQVQLKANHQYVISEVIHLSEKSPLTAETGWKVSFYIEDTTQDEIVAGYKSSEEDLLEKIGLTKEDMDVIIKDILNKKSQGDLNETNR